MSSPVRPPSPGASSGSAPVPAPHAPRARLAVMISGGGRTMLNLHARCQDASLPAEIALVIASSECPGAQRARDAGLPVVVEPGVIDAQRLGALLAQHAVGLVALAGYLKLVRVPPGWQQRILNIHPALLPLFGGKGLYGRHVHEAVLAAGMKVSGCTVHFVDEHYDRGPIILQRVCPVLDEPPDTPDALAARVFEHECIAYPEALRMVIQGSVQVEGARVRVRAARE